MAKIYRRITEDELYYWEDKNINNVYNSIQNEGLFIPGNIFKNYKDEIACGLSFYYKLEQIFTCSLYKPDAYCVISLELPDDVLERYAVAGHYFGYISNGMKTAYEYLIPKEILKKYFYSLKIICNSQTDFCNFIEDFRKQDDSKNDIKKFAEWPERYLSLYNSSNLGKIEWILEQYFGAGFAWITNGLFYPSENYILNNRDKFDFSDKNVGYYILKHAIKDMSYTDLKTNVNQFIIPHPEISVFGYIGKHLIEQEYNSFKDLVGRKDELLECYIDGAIQVFNTTYSKKNIITKFKM